jgi:nitrogen fixation/metabolism regulation signal transduction histidine kinase
VAEDERTALPASAGLSRGTRWALGIGSALMGLVGVLLLFLLTLATNNRLDYERNYNWLFAANVVVAGLLLAILVWGGIRLAIRLRRGRFGSRLLLKLAGIFTLVGLVPGLLIYIVSYQFVSRSIESWFDVQVETVANDMANNTRTAGAQLSQVSDAGAALILERVRDQLGATDVVLWSASEMAVVGPAPVTRSSEFAGLRAIASAGQSRFNLQPERPSAQMLRSLREQRAVASIEGLDDDGTAEAGAAAPSAQVRTLALVPNPSVGLLAEPRYLQATIALPPALVTNALAVQAANREYQERALARGGLQRMYIGTLTLSLFLPSSAPWGWPSCWATSWPARCCCWPRACAMWRAATCGPSRRCRRATRSAGSRALSR